MLEQRKQKRRGEEKKRLSYGCDLVPRAGLIRVDHKNSPIFVWPESVGDGQPGPVVQQQGPCVPNLASSLRIKGAGIHGHEVLW